MSYELVYTHRAKKDIKKLDPFIKKLISKSLLKLKTNPLGYSEKLTDSKIGDYRFRIGDYRVIVDIEGEDIANYKIIPHISSNPPLRGRSNGRLRG